MAVRNSQAQVSITTLLFGEKVTSCAYSVKQLFQSVSQGLQHVTVDQGKGWYVCKLGTDRNCQTFM
jgi:hypothetical protein